MSKPEEKVTDAELAVMQVLWEAEEPVTLAQVKAALAGRNGDTTKTLLRRLCEKGAVGQEKREVYYYAPFVERNDYVKEETKSFLNKFFKGDAKNLAAALIADEDLSREDIEELRDYFRASFR